MNAAQILARTEALVLIELTVINAHVLLDIQALIVKQVGVHREFIRLCQMKVSYAEYLISLFPSNSLFIVFTYRY